jgi:hypothetical protein
MQRQGAAGQAGAGNSRAFWDEFKVSFLPKQPLAHRWLLITHMKQRGRVSFMSISILNSDRQPKPLV